MTHILFVIYTAVFVLSQLMPGDGMAIVIGAMTLASLVWMCFSRLFLLGRGGYYGRKYLMGLLPFLVILPYAILPHRIAAVICYIFLAGWHYVLPCLRLVILRIFYMSAIKKNCRERNYRLERAKGGMVVRTPEHTYDLRVIGSFRRVGAVLLTDSNTYTVRRVLPAMAAEATWLQYAVSGKDGIGTLACRMTVGRERTHRIVWSDVPDAERVLAFLPGLCEWKFAGGEASFTNGSVCHGVILYDADAFRDNRLR